MAFTRNRALVAGDVLTIPVAGASNVGGSFNFTTNASAMPYGVSASYSFITGWNEATGSITVQSLDTIPPNTEVSVSIAGFNLTSAAASPFPGSMLIFVLVVFRLQVRDAMSGADVARVHPGLPMTVTAEVQHEGKMTVIFKNGALMSSYGPSNGDPVGLYTQTGTIPIALGKIYKFRVSAYNGKFKSDSIGSVAHNRAITTPNAPAYFPAMTQLNVTVSLTYEPENIGETTELGISFSTKHELVEGHVVSIPLPGIPSPLSSARASCGPRN